MLPPPLIHILHYKESVNHGNTQPKGKSESRWDDFSWAKFRIWNAKPRGY